MVKLTIELDEDEVKKADIDEFDEAEFWNRVRTHARKKEIIESSNGVFEMDGENALCRLLSIPVELLDLYKHKEQLKYFSKLELNVDGEIEDCKYCILEGI